MGMDCHAHNRGKWNTDSKATDVSVGTFGGIGKHKGEWSMICKSCGWNTTHTTGFHESYVEDPSSFSLPATHNFWTKSGKTPFNKERRSSQPVAITSNLLSSRVGPLITQYKTGSDDSQFSSFLADLERVLS